MAEILDEHGLRNRYHVFEDRYHAGEMLSEKLEEYADRSDVCVLAIPAGGVQVGVVIAERLRAPRARAFRIYNIKQYESSITALD